MRAPPRGAPRNAPAPGCPPPQPLRGWADVDVRVRLGIPAEAELALDARPLDLLGDPLVDLAEEVVLLVVVPVLRLDLGLDEPLGLDVLLGRAALVRQLAHLD